MNYPRCNINADSLLWIFMFPIIRSVAAAGGAGMDWSIIYTKVNNNLLDFSFTWVGEKWG